MRVLGIALIFPIAIPLLQAGIPVHSWILIVTSAIVHALYALSLAKAYEKGDLSLVYPIARLAPIFVLLWSTLIWREAMSPAGIAGVLIIVFGPMCFRCAASLCVNSQPLSEWFFAIDPCDSPG